jgi:hypothetical protein
LTRTKEKGDHLRGHVVDVLHGGRALPPRDRNAHEDWATLGERKFESLPRIEFWVGG